MLEKYALYFRACGFCFATKGAAPSACDTYSLKSCRPCHALGFIDIKEDPQHLAAIVLVKLLIG